ncbi:MAG TPA: Calx-beta domain-containing protein, partial [Verrucomicrobiae bacterium]
IGTDYYATNCTLTFQPGQTVVQAHVPIINNGLPEGNRTISLLLSNAVNTTLTSPSNAVLTIIDSVSAPGQLYFGSPNFTAYSSDGTVYLPVLRTNGALTAVSVGYNLIPGSALPGLNYVNAAGTISFDVNSNVAYVPVQVLNPPYPQPPVSLTVVLSNPQNGATLTTPTNTTLTILNTNVGFAFVNATNSVREINGNVPVFVQRLGATNGGVHVDFATQAGTAQPGVNYTPVSGTLTFAAGEMVKAILLPLLYDSRVTGDQYLTLQLSAPGAGGSLAYPSNTVVVVQDADAGISFTNSASTVLKNAGFAVIPVVCTNTAVEPVIIDSNTVPMSVQYATVDGTARAGIDYSATSGKIAFTNGIGTNYIYVPIFNNSQVLGDHAFSVILSNPTAPAQLVAPSTQTVTIVDNNSGLSFSSPVYSVLKTGVAATITVVRTDFTNTTSYVNFATANGTALAGLDYFPTNGTLVFTNGVTSQSFNVTVIGNTAVQPDKTVLLQLSSPTNGFLVAPSAATLTIHDISGSLVVPAGAALLHESLVTNGIIDPNENVTVAFALRATGGTNVNNLTATLLVTNGVSAPSSPQNYGNLLVNGPSVSRAFSFTATGTNGQTIAPTLLLNNGLTNIGTATFTFTLGTWTTTFYNTNPITIRDFTLASPYPSAITVSNVGGTLVKSTVTLSNLYHGFTRDIEALVVSPAGQDTLIMAHAGNGSVARISLTFDDAASTILSTNSILVTGTNKPSAYPTITPFP